MFKSFINYLFAGSIVLIFMLGVELIVTNFTAFDVADFSFTQWMFSILYWIVCLTTAYYAGIHADADNQKRISTSRTRGHAVNKYRLSR